MGIVGGVLNVGGHNEPFLGPVRLVGTILGVPDIDAVVEGMVGDVVNETWWRDQVLVFFVVLWVFIML